MKRIAAFFTLLFFVHSSLQADHIVGGEIVMKHIDGFRYELTLFQYFDTFQKNNPGPDEQVSLSIYSNKTDTQIQTITVGLTNRIPLAFSVPKCARRELQADRVRYSTEITLSPEVFNDPEGYYITWLRCCRGISIVNIENPVQAGMTYILEFPAVVQNVDEQFINSSPSLPIAFNDNACVDQIYYLDLGATDPDGDSLSHSLVTPLTTTFEPLPPPHSKPYDEVTFGDGYSESEMILGDPSLAITNEGFLTVNPISSRTGIHTFAIKVEEFRDGKKIGEIRRDFRIPIYNDCEPPIPPKVSALDPIGQPLENGDTVEYVSREENKCFEIVVQDLPGETFTYHTELVGYTKQIDGLFSVEEGVIPDNGDPLTVEVCIDDCPPIPDGYFTLDFIISDDTCPLPQRDTLRLTYLIDTPENTRPYFNFPSDEKRVVSINQGKEIALDDIIGRDDDLDSLKFSFFAQGYNPFDIGITMDTTAGIGGRREASLNWNTDCEKYFFGDQQKFDLGLVLEDYDTCLFDTGDTLFYELEVILPPNTAPEFDFLDYENGEIIELNIKDELTINMEAKDNDGDSISLTGNGFGFNFADVGIDFTNQHEDEKISTSLQWDLSCENLNITETTGYTLKFNIEDQDVCKEVNNEEQSLRVIVNVPENHTPMFESNNNSGVIDFDLNIGIHYELDVMVTDLDVNDLVTVDILSEFFRPATDSLKIERTANTGGQVNMILDWHTDCSLLGPNYSPKSYSTFLLAWDDNCPNILQDTIAVNFEVSDLEVDFGSFSPPNAFSPNGDQINDYFVLSNLPNAESNAPADNCRDQFQSINIFDRTGRNVFSSTNREFQWSGFGEEAGTYFYLIQYLKRDFKGTVTLVR